MYGVDADEQGYLQAALHGQTLQMVGFLDGQHMQERGHESVARHLLDIFGCHAGIEGVGGIGGELLGRHRGRILLEVLDAHKLVHLPDLLLERHAGEEVVYAALYRRGRIFI